MIRYEVVESQMWVGPNNSTASIYGAVPYMNEAEKALWSIKTVGWTIRDNKTNTIGIGRKPWKTKQEVEDYINNVLTKKK